MRFDAYDTWPGKDAKKSIYGFRRPWLKELTSQQVHAEWTAIELYLGMGQPVAVRSHGLTERAVQAVVSNSEQTTVPF